VVVGPLPARLRTKDRAGLLESPVEGGQAPRATREVRVVAEPPPHSAYTGVSAGPDGLTLVLVRATDDGDIWRLDLQ
jgi:hypothetical protein